MARKPLRSQLNQIRAWVREGRTDAWIAHQLDLPTAELREFRRRHELAPEDEAGEFELRDEIEAEIEAAMEEEDEEPEDLDEDEDEDEDEDSGEPPEAADDGDEEEAKPKRRRRGRRGRGGKRADGALQATFDHGEKDGYGLWLDPAVKDNSVYSENWAGHRKVEVTIEADQIVIKRS